MGLDPVVLFFVFGLLAGLFGVNPGLAEVRGRAAMRWIARFN